MNKKGMLDDWDTVPGFDEDKKEYVPLDLYLDQWLSKHDVQGEGRRMGEQNLPASDDGQLDACESKILAWINRRGLDTRKAVSTVLSDFERNLTDMDNDEELTQLEQEVDEIRQEAQLNLQQIVRDAWGLRLADLADDVVKAGRDFSRFRNEAGLTRLADDSHRPGALYWIWPAFFIETILNATLLMDVNAFGLLGSTAQMGLISAVNILILGLAMGACLRQRNSVDSVRKAWGWGCVVVLVLVDICFNLAVGHFRDSMQAVLNDPTADLFTLGGDTLKRVVAGPMGFDSFQSMLLALMGFLFFCVASWKWYQRDDPFPGYGQRDRQLQKLKCDYVREYKKAQGDLEKEYGPSESRPENKRHTLNAESRLENKRPTLKSRLEDKRHTLKIKQRKWRETTQRGESLVKNFTTNMEQYQYDLNLLLSAYRTANKEARSDDPPQRFEQQEDIDRSILNPPQFNPPEETSIKRVTDSVHHAITAVFEEYSAARGRLPTLEDVMEGKTRLRDNGKRPASEDDG